MESPPRRTTSYLISLWVDHHVAGVPVWRGALVTVAEQRLHFSTLAQLNRWLCELAGWQDPPPDDTTTEAERG
jgi:hypothetical protein